MRKCASENIIPFQSRYIMGTQNNDQNLEISNIIAQLDSLYLEFSNKINVYNAKSNKYISLSDIDKMYSIYNNNVQSIMKYAYNYYREKILNKTN
jgi:hypothetical protein